MSLNFSLTEIKNYKEVCWLPVDSTIPRMFLDIAEVNGEERMMNPKTHQIIWGCMPVGIGVISERTAPEWYARYSLWCRIKKLTESITMQDVKDHIGLSTNVFPEESRTKWMKRIVAAELDDFAREFTR